MRDAQQTLEQYFLEMRWRCLSLAADLDRVERAAGGRALLLSIHQLHDAARVCDRLVLLSDGRVVGEGTLDELRARANRPDGDVEDVFLALT